MENSVIPDHTMAFVVKVVEITPIPAADKIELAKVLGWQVIVKKGEFQAGDLAIYFSIGSMLSPDDINFAFLQGKPIKTRKIFGTLSQGLLFPLLISYGYGIKDLKENDDLTRVLNVRKWVSREEIALYSNNSISEFKTSFPYCIPKTNEERVQNISKKLVELQNKPIVITQKYDGTSSTYMLMNGKFVICGRNHLLLKENSESHHYFEIAKRYNMEEKMIKMFKDSSFQGRNIAIQGEIIGQRQDGKYKINSNRHKLLNFEFYVFNIFDIDKRYYMSWNELLEITKYLCLKTVPLIYSGLMKEKWLDVDSLLDLAAEQRYEGGHICEGIVVKSDEGFGFPRTSFKVISNEYLLKYNL